MTHPSIQGLREAAGIECWRCASCGAAETWASATEGVCPSCGHGVWQSAVLLDPDRVAAYLAEHGVGWFGEGLVREVGQATRTTVYLGRRYDRWELTILPDSGIDRVVGLVPVPQDGE